MKKEISSNKFKELILKINSDGFKFYNFGINLRLFKKDNFIVAFYFRERIKTYYCYSYMNDKISINLFNNFCNLYLT